MAAHGSPSHADRPAPAGAPAGLETDDPARARSRRRVRPLRAAVPALLVAAVVGGCTYIAPQDTQRSMVPGDGLNFTLGPDISVSSLLIVAREEDEPGVLVARVVNSGGEPVSVAITGAGLDEDLEVPPGQTVQIGGVDENSQVVVIDAVPERPGKYVSLAFATDDGRSREAVAPVMDGTFDEYKPYLAEIPTS